MPSIGQTLDEFSEFFGDPRHYVEIATLVHTMLVEVFKSEAGWTAYGYLSHLRQTTGDMCRYQNVLKSQSCMEEYKAEIAGQATCSVVTLAAAHKRLLNLMKVLGDGRIEQVPKYMEGTANHFVLYTLYSRMFEEYSIPLFQELAESLKAKAESFCRKYPGAGRFFPEEFKPIVERIDHERP